MTMIRFQKLMLSAIACTALLSMAQVCEAQVVPFKSIGKNNAFSPITAEFGGEGLTSYMGATFGGGFAIPVETEDPLVYNWFTIGGNFVAPNGDQIFFTGGGTLYLNPLEGQTSLDDGGLFTAAWVGNFQISGGTGRFANVGPGTADLEVIAINHPFDSALDPLWFYDYWITGDIDLGNQP